MKRSIRFYCGTLARAGGCVAFSATLKGRSGGLSCVMGPRLLGPLDRLFYFLSDKELTRTRGRQGEEEKKVEEERDGDRFISQYTERRRKARGDLSTTKNQNAKKGAQGGRKGGREKTTKRRGRGEGRGRQAFVAQNTTTSWFDFFISSLAACMEAHCRGGRTTTGAWR